LRFVSLLRLPDFVSRENFDWALQQTTIKKKTDFSKVEFLTYDEGFCVQCLHIAPHNEKPITIERMHTYMENEGYQLDITDERMHHEIYISDFRKTEPARLKTVLRHPIKKAQNSSLSGHWIYYITKHTALYSKIFQPCDFSTLILYPMKL